MRAMATNKKTITDFKATDKEFEAAYEKYRDVYNVSSDLDIFNAGFAIV